MSKKLLLIFITFAILFFAVSCSNKTNTEKDTNPNGDAVTVFAVSTTLAVEGEIKDYLQLNGDITASTTVDTFPDTAGKLKNLYVKVGDTVRKNQIIAEIDPSKPGMNFASSPVKA
ncbi:MAG: efflux RND transporter periplasmic adaptor subunit, partial [Spirochaetales bacterium]|nr:efflux RND transporter periplasmic adaptor subunit [Spirochaetales bacterium]